MSFASSVLAMSILMAGPNPTPTPTPTPAAAPAALVASEVRFLEMTGLDWRAQIQPQMERITAQGSATVWTTSRENAQKIAQAASRVLTAPRVTALSNVQAFISTASHQTYVAHLKAVPVVEGNPVTGFQPMIDSVRDGLKVQIAGRTLDQGTLLKVALDDSHLIAMHTVAGKKPAADCCAEEAKPGVGVCQVPEVARCQVNGEWLVPPQGALVISLGARTVKGAQDKAVIQERVVVIETKAVASPGVAFIGSGPHIFTKLNDPALGRVVFQDEPAHTSATVTQQPPPALPTLPKADLPRLPSRTLPHGTTADGKPLQPNVPDDAIEITSSETGGEVRATPQSHPRKSADVNLVDRPESKGSVGVGTIVTTLPADPAPRTKTTSLTAVESKPDAVRVELTISAIPLGPAKGQLQLRLTPEGRINAEFQMSSASAAAPARDPEIKQTAAEAPTPAAPCCRASASKGKCCESK